MFSSLLCLLSLVLNSELTTRQKTYHISSFGLSMFVAVLRTNTQKRCVDLQTDQVLVLLPAECSPGHDGHPDDGLHRGDGQCWEGHLLHSAVFNLLPGCRGTLWHWGCCHVLDKQGRSAAKTTWGFLCCLCDLIRDERLGFMNVGRSGLFWCTLFLHLLFMGYKKKSLQKLVEHLWTK